MLRNKVCHNITHGTCTQGGGVEDSKINARLNVAFLQGFAMQAMHQVLIYDQDVRQTKVASCINLPIKVLNPVQ